MRKSNGDLEFKEKRHTHGPLWNLLLGRFVVVSGLITVLVTDAVVLRVGAGLGEVGRRC